jgi:prolyl oligopeptidase
MFVRKLVTPLFVLATCCSAQPIAPPATRTIPVTETLHGVTLTDPYRWLEDQNSPDTRSWIDAQDKATRAYLSALPGRDALIGKLQAFMKIESRGTPTVRNNRYFYSLRTASEDRTSLYMRQGFDGKDKLLVDVRTATDDPTTSLALMAVSADGRLIAFGSRRGGEDELSVRLLNVETLKYLPDTLPRGRYGSFSIKPDKSGFYYSRFTPGEGPRAWYHAMGTPNTADKQIFGQGYGPDYFIDCDVSENGRWLILSVEEGTPAKRTEFYVQDLAKPGPIVNLLKDEADVAAADAGDWLFLSTNLKAANRRIFRIDMKKPARAEWKEVVPESGQPIESFSATAGRLFVHYIDNVSSRIKQFDADGKYLGDLKLPGIGTVFGLRGRWADDDLYYTFTSFVQPAAAYRLKPATGKQDLWFQPKVPVDSGNIEVKQVWYPSKDGTKIPMFLIARKGLQLDGNRPVYLTGYGGFNVSETPAFSSVAAIWAEMGGVFAVANLRGGGEFGESWHHAGMFEHKQNVFDDFIGAAEWLVQNRYTRPERLGIAGGSNGGLLMGAMMTQRPDLFGAIICGAPLLDMLRYHKMSVGAWWVTEYGSAEDPKQFSYLRQYSPYHNVKQGVKYPAILFVTGDSDTRVDPAHARKMTALMQAANASSNPILLRYDAKGGHSAIGSVNKTIEETADRLSFLASRLGFQFQ